MKRYIKRHDCDEDMGYDFSDDTVKCSEQEKNYGPDENGLYGPFYSVEEMRRWLDADD